jgi:hypothetical protein
MNRLGEPQDGISSVVNGQEKRHEFVSYKVAIPLQTPAENVR